MVFKPFTHLARQAFTKTFVHGYAQSVVAASQSSYASTNTSLNQFTNLPAKYTRTAQLQNAFQNASGSSSAGSKTGHGSSGNSGSDSGLAAYYAAWQQAQQNGDENDWHQFQFRKRIGWKPSSQDAKESEGSTESNKNVSPLSASQTKVDISSHDPKETRDFRKVESVAVDADVSAQVDEAVAREIQQIHDAEALSQVEEEPDVSTAESTNGVESIEATSSKPTPESSLEEPSLELDESSKDVEILKKVQAQSGRVMQLADTKQYSLVPGAFESILKEGLVPTVGAYNALLEAAIHLHTDIYHAVPKALDVYSDMLRRSVLPNEQTYTILVQLLASRALKTFQSIQILDEQRARYGGMEEEGKFMFQSSEAEHELLSEDHSLSIAMKLFNAATSHHADILFPLETYCTLITACAKRGEVEQMIKIFAHMETHKVVPHATIFPSMIDAFAANGDLKSAVECYNEYKALAIADDSGVFGIIERRDAEVYAALIKAYLSCGKEAGALRFFDKIRSSFDEVKEDREARKSAVEDVVVKDGLMQHAIKTGSFSEALKTAREYLSKTGLESTSARICMAAADSGNIAVASEAYDLLPLESPATMGPASAMLALHIRQGHLASAKPFWAVLSSPSHATPDLIHPTAMYTVALLKSGQVEEGLMEARKMFTRIRNSVDSKQAQAHLREEIDETIDLLGRVMIESSAVLSAHASMTLIWAMIENGGLVSPVAEHVIASLGPSGISQLSIQDLTLALQVQAGMLVNTSELFDAANPARFAHMLELALAAGIPMHTLKSRVLEEAILKIADSRPDLVQRWRGYVQSPVDNSSFVPARYTPVPQPSPDSKPTTHEDTFDPYAHATDFRGSAVIADILENASGRAENQLNDAMIKFKNMRRIGRHPRYITYAKLIAAAAKCGRVDLVHEILGMARHDVPLIPQYKVVKYGWTSILDAMVAASLTLGERGQAAKYHQELNNIGSAPSANTFGLYITTLKESTKTFDEATEAVKIFHRAISEGVDPTSFLYNALIGKLGKARRIDDCLLYFAEMRANGIRPTSVTYGTIVNALCRVSDERFAEEMFDEMESMPNYKPRPAPYNSIIQYFLNTKRDRSKVLAYYERMKTKHIQPTMHTYKLLIDAYASLEPVDMKAAEEVLDTIRSTGKQPEAVHFASLIHAKGCVMHDMDGARKIFDSVISSRHVQPQPCLYQALFEAMVANHKVSATAELLKHMVSRNVEMTPYIANTLIHGWAADGNIANALSVYNGIGISKREPSTYEAMTRAFLAAEDRQGASGVVQEMLSRGYPSAVTGKVLELVGGGTAGSPPA
ncbi:pentatricopeptide repeat protein [Histoplasma capsulatum G186AR]|uniref:Pentatricopeptide repeat protein n=2 Tax=Ajellomyces capsulatus TaxID=5037 RepID=C0NP57_AJECG|nr:pentatricopeptide repeat protein [Histoplasma capsulatum G186AR]EEH06717.1 pentatricopeptide repeat protein [Histoplasma capsulatum G186AR]KAG5304749.1 pentatricopeptide repeat protein [Histoplasma capsulatum]QSS75708.1 pentatricopeptide repeat protein [Histoplasma capsulatum G186AR]